MNHNHNDHNHREPEPPKGGDKVVYTCPMHPEINQDRPGMCPECGMNLVQSVKRKTQKNGNEVPDKHKGHSTEMFLRKFWVSLLLTIPVVLFHFELINVPRAKLVTFALGLVVFFYGGWVFLVGARRELVGRQPGMMTLIALAILTAFIYSVYGTFYDKEPLFWELTTLITIMLLGHYLEMRAVGGAQSALKELAKLLPDEAEVVREKEIVKIPLVELKAGDIILVRPGGKVAADGVIAEGASDINESMVTGESRPVDKTMGDKVVAGTINGSGSLKIKVTQIGEKTFLAGVMRMVKEAEASKSRLQILSDRAAFYLTVTAIVAALLTLVIWLSVKPDFSFAIARVVAVLVIACPHALGLAIPLVASISTTLAAKKGFLVRQRQALEAARNIDTVLFDKTGTLTKGEYGVEQIVINDDMPTTEEEILKLAASVDAHSEHHIAKAIVRGAQEKKLDLMPVQGFKALPGKGVTAKINDSEVFIGGEAILNYAPSSPPLKVTRLPARQGGGKGELFTTIYIIKNKKLLGSIALRDIIRHESRDAIASLKDLGVKVAMLTGDSEEVAKAVATELGIEEYFARILPQEKAEKVKLLQKRGQRVGMVGDGINDAPALTQADIGIAIGAGTNVAIESAGIILVKNDPRDIPKIIKLSRATYSKMMQNLFWATGYNVVALPLAAGVLAFRGILLEPALGALFMSLSTVIVAINAVLLKKSTI